MRTIVGIDGIDGSGKSHFARRLAQACRDKGLGVVELSVDSYRDPSVWKRVGRSEAELYYDDYYDLRALARCLQEFSAGASQLCLPQYNAVAEAPMPPRIIDIRATHIAVVEGVFVQRVVSHADIVIWLSISVEEARRRIVERDMRKGRSRAEVIRRIEQRYFPCQERYAREHDPAGCAHLTIDNTDYTRPQIVKGALSCLPASIAQGLQLLVRE